MIRFDRVSFRYNESKETSSILQEVSFSLKKGQIYGLIGGNGTGKSTIAKLAAALLQPDSGTIFICDEELDYEKASIHRKVGIIFQNPENQIVGTTVEEDLAFGLENLGIAPSEMRERVDAIAHKFHLNNYLTQPVEYLSGGQKQLLCIASVMIMEPEWLIFDEPTSHLDPWARKEFWQVVNQLSTDEGKGIIVISQHPEDMQEFSHSLVISNANIVFQDKTEELWERKEKAEWKVCIPENIKLMEMIEHA